MNSDRESLTEVGPITPNEKPEDIQEFRVPLSGPRHLKLQLQKFKEACDAHEKHTRKRCKKRYIHLGLMAKLVSDTTEEELRHLLRNGARTFLIDMVLNTPDEFNRIYELANTVIEEYKESQQGLSIVTGLAIEIQGDCCRVGRMHNNCSVLVHRGDIMTLTVDQSYKQCSYREVAYVYNLHHYIRKIKLCDELHIGREVRGTVVKVLKDTVAVCIREAGLLNSYEYIEFPNQCFILKQENYIELFKDDLNEAARVHADFVILPRIRCKSFIKMIHNTLKEQYNMKLIGTLDYEYINRKMLDLMGLTKLLDYVWIPDMFTVNESTQAYIYNDGIPIAKSLKKPLIGTVPLERCSDFKQFEDHDFLWKIDTVCIEKSQWCNRYPLIVKKLLPIRDFRRGVIENFLTLKHVSSYQSIVNFIIRTISTIECQAIIIYSRCEAAPVALSRAEIYCPVYIAMPILGETDEESQVEFARAFNMRRNLHTIMYTSDMNICEFSPIDFVIDYARKQCLLETGDFVITIEVCKAEQQDISFGMGEDVVILRCYYLPPIKFGDKFKDQ